MQLWANNIEKVESKDSRKAWEEICKALNELERQGLKKTDDQCQRKVKDLKNQYKEKDWNRRQSGGNLCKSPHYDIIDSVFGWSKLVDRLHKTVEARKIVQRPVLLKHRAVPVQLVAPPLQPLFVQWEEDAKEKK